MVDLLERIGPYLGVAAFLGLAILAFLIIQQAREVRRLREWAGRAPERADEADEATQAAAGARGEQAAPREGWVDQPGWLGRRWAAVKGAISPRLTELNRRFPVDPRYPLALLAAAVIAVIVLTSGFGLLGGSGEADGGDGGGGEKAEKVEVAVLNGTATETPDGVVIEAVSGLAAEVSERVIKPAGYKPGKEADAAEGFDETTIMFDTGEEGEAEALAGAVRERLGETPVTPMIDEVRERSGGAPLALIIGLDDDGFGSPEASGE